MANLMGNHVSADSVFLTKAKEFARQAIIALDELDEEVDLRTLACGYPEDFSQTSLISIPPEMVEDGRPSDFVYYGGNRDRILLEALRQRLYLAYSREGSDGKTGRQWSDVASKVQLSLICNALGWEMDRQQGVATQAGYPPATVVVPVTLGAFCDSFVGTLRADVLPLLQEKSLVFGKRQTTIVLETGVHEIADFHLYPERTSFITLPGSDGFESVVGLAYAINDETYRYVGQQTGEYDRLRSRAYKKSLFRMVDQATDMGMPHPLFLRLGGHATTLATQRSIPMWEVLCHADRGDGDLLCPVVVDAEAMKKELNADGKSKPLPDFGISRPVGLQSARWDEGSAARELQGLFVQQWAEHGTGKGCR